jgi:hypothetical protein
LRWRKQSLLFLWLIPAAVLAAAQQFNAVTIADLSGSADHLRPFTISRFFARGEIRHYAQARVNGRPVMTQCDVKTRWPDGSVQHALVSFLSEVKPFEELIVDFADQPSGNNDGALSVKQMLRLDGIASPGAWGARIEAAAGGVRRAADARAMLANGSWRYWLRGPVCTQVIVEAARGREQSAFAYDFGWKKSGGSWVASSDPAYRSLHPIFVLTFYAHWPGVKVDCILENAWTTKLQDQQYSLVIYKDDPPKAVYRRSGFVHIARSRWRKTFWSGKKPGAVNIDYNLPYMIFSRALPSYDLTKTVSAKAIAQEAGAFLRSDQGDLGGTGQWQPYFPATGGRPDIGLFPRWYVRYLYTFDPGLYRVLLGNAAVSGYIPVHYRESLPGRSFDASGLVDALGRTLSINARPTVRTTNQAQDTKPRDRIIPVGAVSSGKWTVDLAHQPSIAFIPYLITGDWYFLEELYFWASFDLANGNPGTALSYNRHADWGFLNDDLQIRGVAWALRNVAHAALAAPDGTPEKAYFKQKLDYNIAVREGKYDIKNGAFYSPCRTRPYSAEKESSPWCWGRNTVAGGKKNPLHFLEAGAANMLEGLNKATVFAGSSPWMLNYNHIVLGYLKELGFPAGKLQEVAAKNLLNQILNPDYNPFLIASYRIPVRKRPEGVFFDSWAAVKAGYIDSSRQALPESQTTDVEHGYAHIARAAASFLPGIRDGGLRGEDAWDWMNANVSHQDLLHDNPKWALTPRCADGIRPAELQHWLAELRRVRRERKNMADQRHPGLWVEHGKGGRG